MREVHGPFSEGLGTQKLSLEVCLRPFPQIPLSSGCLNTGLLSILKGADGDFCRTQNPNIHILTFSSHRSTRVMSADLLQGLAVCNSGQRKKLFLQHTNIPCRRLRYMTGGMAIAGASEGSASAGFEARPPRRFFKRSKPCLSMRSVCNSVRADDMGL